jgi:hypothetical protein
MAIASILASAFVSSTFVFDLMADQLEFRSALVVAVAGKNDQTTIHARKLK